MRPLFNSRRFDGRFVAQIDLFPKPNRTMWIRTLVATFPNPASI
jgi:hypothetical protein